MVKNKPVFATFFPHCENVHLTKEVGMIPYILYRDFGYDSYLICYNNGDYPGLDTEVSGLKLLFFKKNKHHFKEKINKFIRKKRGHFFGIIRWFFTALDFFPIIFKYGKQIDIFQIYHIGLESFVAGLIYRIINRKGIIYWKLDIDNNILKFYENIPKKMKIKNQFKYFVLKLISPNIVSVESKKICEFIRTKHPYFKKFKERVCYIPSGVNVDNSAHLNINFTGKENTILHVGRIGTYQKASEIVLEVFVKIARDFPNWKLVLIGTMERPFAHYFDELLKKHKDIQDKIQYLGFINSKKSLYEYYKKAKILVIPSRFESFGLVAAEAGLFGDVVLGSDIPSIRDITNDGKFAYLCPIDDVKSYEENLRYMLSHENELKEKSKLIMEFITDEFNWIKICNDLHKIISNKLRISNNIDL